MMKLKKWKLLSKQDISPSKWFPLEKRSYQLSNGRKVDDFFVTTLADSVHIISMTKEGKVVMIRMYKQGVDEIMIQFPAGRLEDKHKDLKDVAVKELEEEAGIKVHESELKLVGKVSLMTTKATELAHFYFVSEVTFNSKQNLDDNEEIEVITLLPREIDEYIKQGKIWDAPCIAGWELVKRKYL
ncbi:MAG: NUDIX hydrolase [Candidatus Pacebacteria bacterium]|jgi:ADP-ribose pyrophosphatase|nr:NUDIX hydrolase [Candidatus Paceibacterota bacterium]MBT3512284.1 NUDIX hydrolase [Candidatus Paceibacterota bacterium]MBT4004522.1 NUDIX hydrolase [Candidatus Paceibacterota bacterium]MBT4358854.1 NUDIX hydrolase [Candidatus Paceibacterota bacterium]MBT4681197.1 NUDIX hydrolase [Candidatus Paceibacterota bacterium]